MPKVVTLALGILVGLNTDPNGDCLGARSWALNIEDAVAKQLEAMSKVNDHLKYLSSDIQVKLVQPPSFLSYTQVTAANACSWFDVHFKGVADVTTWWGHSFGGAAGKFIGDQLDMRGANESKANGTDINVQAGMIDLFLAADPAPNIDRFSQLFSWQLSDLSDSFRWNLPHCFGRGHCLYQRKEQALGFGVCGVPFKSEVRVQNDKAATLGWDLDHVGCASDQRALQMWTAEVANACIRKAYQGKVGV